MTSSSLPSALSSCLPIMDPKTIVHAIIAELETKLVVQTNAAKDAHEAATHSESVAENKYDTFGLESSYLAQGQQKRVEEIHQALSYFSHLNPNSHNDLLFITLIDDDDQTLAFFLAKHAGGLKVTVEGIAITVITYESPIGMTLAEKSIGDSVNIMVKGVNKTYEISAVC